MGRGEEKRKEEGRKKKLFLVAVLKNQRRLRWLHIFWSEISADTCESTLGEMICDELPTSHCVRPSVRPSVARHIPLLTAVGAGSPEELYSCMVLEGTEIG